MKKLVRKLARSLGLEITRCRPSSSCPAQLAMAIEVGRIDVVFDVGANEGQFAKEIQEYGYTGKSRQFRAAVLGETKAVSAGWV